MPAVAQISVDFARTSEVQNTAGTDLPTTVKSVSPRTLQQYMLYNRELQADGENFGILDPKNLSYLGGFLTAGDKINVKHNDLQLRENLEVGKEVRAEFIVSRNKENNDLYENVRDLNTRAVTISPRTADLTNTYVKIATDPNLRSITLYTLRATTESSLRIANSSSDTSISLKTTLFTLNATTISITGSTTHTGTVVITGKTTINNTVEIKDDLKIGTTSFNKFNVTGSSGDVAFTGNLTIDTNKFIVTSSSGETDIAGNLNVGTTSYNKFNVTGSSGNTSIQGTLSVAKDVSFTKNLSIGEDVSIAGNLSVTGTSTFTSGATFSSTVNIDGALDVDASVDILNNLLVRDNLTVQDNATVEGNMVIEGTTTMSNALTLNGGGATATTRRITGVRTLVDINEFNGTSYDNDAITVGDVKKYGFKKGMIMMWWPIDPDNYADNFVTSGTTEGLGKNNMLGWAVCNGKNNTPDLVNRFVVGGRASDGRTTITGTATRDGGTTSHTHTIPRNDMSITASGGGGTVEGHTLTNAQIPSHYHGVGGHSGFGNNDGQFIGRSWSGAGGPFQLYGVIGDGYGAGNAGTANSGILGTSNNINIAAGSEHTHGFTAGSINISQPRYLVPQETHIPNYYSLIYIIKIT